MNRAKFQETVTTELQRLFQAARARDEFAFLFAVLGMDSGMEEAGWQPIGEAQAFVQDLLGLINGPLHQHAKVRTGLLLYCHIIEANFIYHCLYNLLLTVEGQAPPKVFSFLDKYKNGIPPGVPVKIGEIKAKAIEHKFLDINAIFDQIVRPEIRDAFLHSDYILIEDELRLKHAVRSTPGFACLKYWSLCRKPSIGSIFSWDCWWPHVVRFPRDTGSRAENPLEGKIWAPSRCRSTSAASPRDSSPRIPCRCGEARRRPGRLALSDFVLSYPSSAVAP